MSINVNYETGIPEQPYLPIVLQNEIDWDFSKFNPGKVKTAQNLREFDRWVTWIKETFDFSVPFNYLEIGSYAGESLYYLSQVFPKGSQITLVDLGDNKTAREILLRVCKHIEIEFGHRIVLLSGLSDNPEILHKVLEYPRGQALYDMVFIDANHDFEWAYRDYTNYRDKASFIAFHDISDFNIVKNKIKYNRDVANAAHLWKGITLMVDAKEWVEFIDYDNSVELSGMSLKPRGIGVITR